MASTPDAATSRRIHRRVLGWYAARGRPLAFRATSDPWAILVSEVMAQQTQAARAAEAWERFIAVYPTPRALAEASPADVLRAWRGLGYNRRALALQRAAHMILGEHDGRLPRDLAALRRLPGVGPYTARALAALAFGQRVGAVDTNVRRVLGRAFFEGPPDERELQALADQVVPARRPGSWTHALMDVGATVCRVRNPRCQACPLGPECRWASTHAGAGDAAEARSSRPGRDSRRFGSTSRWLRGRILDRLRDAGDGAWLPFGEAIGSHDVATVAVALAALERDGLAELRWADPPEARLPTA